MDAGLTDKEKARIYRMGVLYGRSETIMCFVVLLLLVGCVWAVIPDEITMFNEMER